MKPLLLALTFLLGIGSVARADFDPHRFQVKTYEEWASDILSRLPFQKGTLTQNQYEKFAAAYEKSLTDFYQSVAERKIKEANTIGHTATASHIQLILQDQIEQIRTYIQTSKKGIFLSLDPENKDSITITDAHLRLLKIARSADMNRNGVLEPIEIDIAEAILLGGVDINDPNALHVMLNDLDRRERWAPEN